MPTAEVDGVTIAYRRAGAGPPLVLLHGAASDGREWGAQLDGLADELTVIAWDEPGAGGSDDPPDDYGIGDYADSLAGFLDALGIETAHVGGLSWGGVVAQELYRRHPGRIGSLILIDTYAGWKGSLTVAECEHRLAAALEQTAAPAQATFGPTLPGLFGPDPPAEAVEELTSIMADSRPQSLRRNAIALAACDTRELLGRIAVPTLLIWGEEDARSPLSVARVLEEMIPDARLVLVPGAGHVSNMERPELVNAAIRDFCLAGDRR